MKFNFKKTLLLIICLILPLTAGFIGTAFTVKNISSWYAELNKPFFSPPNWLFAPVWTILYVMMGISSYLVLIKQKTYFTHPIKVFFLHLAVNSFWSIAFFGMKNPGFGFFVIIILWGLIYYLIGLFSNIDKRASNLLIPYLAWVSFASILNLSVWILN